MKRIRIDSVERGDIILTARPGKISKAIRAVTSGQTSHAMICVGDGSFIDSTGDSVQAGNFQRELFEDNEKAFLLRLKCPLDDVDLKTIIDYARSEIGVRYSSLEAGRLVVGDYKPRLRRQFCSRLVARAYEKANIKLVEDADYCLPEDLLRSPQLKEMPVEFEQVSEEELARMSDRRNPIKATRDSQNAVLQAARSIDPKVENFSELHALLVRSPESDSVVSDALVNSGYLDIWKIEVENHPWRYYPGQINKLAASPEELRDYCIFTVKTAYSGEIRFAENLVQLQGFEKQYPRKSFCLEINLYQTLVKNSQNRREIAYGWLESHYPDQLCQYMEEIKPHTPEWLTVIERVQPRLALEVRELFHVFRGNINYCTSCRSQLASAYRLVNGAETVPGVPSLRLCECCLKFYTNSGFALMPFLREY